MMENRFFTWIWRYNGLAIALSVTCLMGLLAWELTSSWRRELFPARATEVLNVAPNSDTSSQNDTSENRAFLAAPREVTSKGVYAVPRYVEQTYQNRGISKESGGNLTNFLIVNSRDQSDRWLFETNDRLIIDTRTLYHRKASGGQRTLGLILMVIETDTNGDERLSRNDLATLYFTPLDWSKTVMLVEQVKTLLAATPLNEIEVDLMYQTPSETKLVRMTLPNAEIAFSMALSPAQ